MMTKMPTSGTPAVGSAISGPITKFGTPMLQTTV